MWFNVISRAADYYKCFGGGTVTYATINSSGLTIPQGKYIDCSDDCK